MTNFYTAHPENTYPDLVYPGQVIPLGLPTTGETDPTASVDYRFDLLDRDEHLLGEIRSVQPGGEITWHSTKSIKAGGTMTVTDVGQVIDWPNARVRIVRIHTRADGDVEEYPLGVFLTSAPVETWTASGRAWEVELLDKCSIPDSDIVTDADGTPLTYSVTVGQYVSDVVTGLLTGLGEATPAISREASGQVIRSDMTWEIGTTVLKIINDLLNAANHFSLWCDEYGRYRVTPYTTPAERPVMYADGTAFGPQTPFSHGESSLMAPEWQRDLDVYAIPNRVVAITSGSDADEAIVAVATNEDPASPFSFVSRGRWITQVETDVDAVDEDALEAHAQRSLEDATRTTVGVQAEHMFLPQVRINSVVHFINEPAGWDARASVLNTTIPLDPLELCKTEFREVGGESPTWAPEVES